MPHKGACRVLTNERAARAAEQAASEALQSFALDASSASKAVLAAGKDAEANEAALRHWAAVSSGREAKRENFQAWVSFARLEVSDRAPYVCNLRQGPTILAHRAAGPCA